MPLLNLCLSSCCLLKLVRLVMSTNMRVMRLKMTGSPEDCFMSCPEAASHGWRRRWERAPGLRCVLNLPSPCSRGGAAAAPGLRQDPRQDADPLVFPEPFLFPEISNSLPGFSAPRGVYRCLESWHRILRNICSTRKNKYAEHSSFRRVRSRGRSAAQSKQAPGLSLSGRLDCLLKKEKRKQEPRLSAAARIRV